MAGTRGLLLAGTLIVVLALPGGAAAATIEVTRFADELDGVADEKCSLREAVQSARLNTAIGGCDAGGFEPDTVKLAARDYELTIPTTNEAANANGDLDLTGGGAVTVRGKGREQTAVTTALADRIFEMHGGGTLKLRDLTVAGGDVTSFGAGLGRGGNLGTHMGGTLTLGNVKVAVGDAYVGGGLYLAASIPSTLTVRRSRFVGNGATDLAGGLDAILDVDTSISKSTFKGNTVSGPDATVEAGAISNRGASMTISDSQIVDNHAISDTGLAAYGGGIRNSNDSKLTIRRTLVADNTASALTDGEFEAGGGLFTTTTGETVKITNSTFVDNDAGAPDGVGGAIHMQSGTTIVTNVTFALNSAAQDGDSVYGDAGELRLRNSILPGLEGFLDPCAGDFVTSGGFNLAAQDDPECNFGADDNTASGNQGVILPPADNGGPTPTIALRKPSPAVNMIPKSACKPARREDQRGYRRPALGNRCDAGSFERGAHP